MSKRRNPFIPASSHKVAQFTIEPDLPISIYKGVGKVITAHAILETMVSELVFDLMRVDYPAGRTAFPYSAASKQFTLARELIALRGITSSIDLVDLEDQIKDCTTARDQLAHGVWLRGKNGSLGLRLTE